MHQKQLWISAKGGDLSGVVSAISQGADVNFQYSDEGDATVLQCAALYGHTDIVTKLASLGADINSADKHKWTALHDAALNGHTETVAKLVSLGASINARTDVEEEAPGAGLRTPLTCAAMNGHTETVKQLASLGAEVGARQKDGWTALHLAAKNGWDDTVSALVQLGIDVNTKNEVDMTALHYAAWDATVETCQKLIDLGVDVTHKAKGKVLSRLLLPALSLSPPGSPLPLLTLSNRLALSLSCSLFLSESSNQFVSCPCSFTGSDFLLSLRA